MSIVNYRHGLGEAPVTPVQPAQQFYEEPAELVIDKALLANQELLDQALHMDGDSDFVWMATKGNSTGVYEFRFRFPNGRYLSSARVRSTNAVGTAQFPVPMFPAMTLGAGAKLGYDIKDLSTNPNTVQIVLIGVRRYRV